VGNVESRIARLEEQIGAAGCTCEGRRDKFVLLNYINGPPAAELDALKARCRWQCPAHGLSSVALLVSLRLNSHYRGSQHATS
jgi:hypothetical protein